MVTYGLIGYPLTNSWSELYFAEKFRKSQRTGTRYINFPLTSPGQLSELLSFHKDIMGLNVTIPYKVKIIPFLNSLDETAARIGAVNTILISRREGQIITRGYNTDAYGFQNSADFSGHRNALLLGTGGAAKAVSHALSAMGISWQFVSRSRQGDHTLNYKDLTPSVISDHTLIINATPVGSYPGIGASPGIPYSAVSNRHFLYDLIYYPEITVFLSEGICRDAHVQNGLKMLQVQAEESLRIWDGQKNDF
jgi:shikimate dehydrogenase